MSDGRDEFKYRKRHHRWSLAAWFDKFRCAFRGWWIGSLSQTSFGVHYLVGFAVIGLAFFLRCDTHEWGVLILSIGLVWMTELMNSAIEALSRAVSEDYNPHIRDALDIASGAVLVMSLGVAVIGCIIFIPKLLALIS